MCFKITTLIQAFFQLVPKCRDNSRWESSVTFGLSLTPNSSHLSKGCLTMIMFVAFSEPAASFSLAPLMTGATARACSFGCLEHRYCWELSLHNDQRSLGMLLHDLLNFKHILPGQLQQVVQPVGWGGFEDRAPDQGPRLESEKYSRSSFQMMIHTGRT